MFTLPHLLRIAHPAAILRNDVQRRLETAAPTASLPVQVWADGEAATVHAALPGYALEDIEVEVHERKLRLSGERKADDERTYVRRERFTGRFDQRITLPFSVEANGAQAHLTNGVLEVRLPRLESDKPRKIAINGQDQ